MNDFYSKPTKTNPVMNENFRCREHFMQKEGQKLQLDPSLVVTECQHLFGGPLVETTFNQTSANNSTWYRYSSIFEICLLFDLGYRGLWFASRTNLESWPQFAEVCFQLSAFILWSNIHFLPKLIPSFSAKVYLWRMPFKPKSNCLNRSL